MVDNQPSGRSTAATIWTLTRLMLVGLSCAALLTLLARQFWLADVLANLRIQQLIGIATVLLVCSVIRRPSGILWAIVLGLAHLPWMTLSRGENAMHSTSNTPLTITVANARTSNPDHDAVLADLIARDPDVIAVLEVSTTLANKLTSRLSETYQYSSLHPQDNGNFGIAMFAKYPMSNSDTFALNLDRVRSIDATIRHDGNAYLITATHPVPPIGKRGFDARNKHLGLLAKRLNSRREMKHCLVIGDLNVTPWSPIYADFLDATKLRRAQVGLDIRPTWYRGPGFPFGLVLDHGLISDGLHCTSHQVGPDVGSDHRSVTIKVLPIEP